MEVPDDSDVATYANSDLTATVKLLAQHGLRFLTAGEIRTEMPEYPTAWTSRTISHRA
jgi:hypothetical protein